MAWKIIPSFLPGRLVATARDTARDAPCTPQPAMLGAHLSKRDKVMPQFPTVDLPPEVVQPLVTTLCAYGDELGLTTATVEVSYLRYDVGARQTPHADDHRGGTRTVSAGLALSARSTYAGGTFQIGPDLEPVVLDEGDLIVFTSDVLHAVSPLERGTRLMVVAFGHSTFVPSHYRVR